MITNQNHYNLQGQRNYPIEDSATSRTDAGVLLRDNVLVDCNIRFPEAAGSVVFLSGLNVTTGLVTVIFAASDDRNTVSSFVPLAAVTVAQPVTPYRPYPVQAVYPGVGGWVVFGHGIDEALAARFSTPAQSRILPKLASAYQDLPVTSIQKQHNSRVLTGLVTLRAGQDISITKGTRLIDGEQRDALVIALATSTAGRNPLAEYIGPCGVRPESQNCDREVIEFINQVSPDCNGNIELVFEGLDVYPFENCGPGLVVDHKLGLDTICPTPFRFNADAKDQCDEDYAVPVSSSSLSVSSVSRSSIGDSLSISSISTPCTDIPYVEDFSADDHYFNVVSGSFTRSSGLYYATHGWQRNISLAEICTAGSLPRTVSTDIQLQSTFGGRNGGLVLNYRVDFGTPSYWWVWLDGNTSRLRVSRHTGSGYIHEQATSILPLVVGDWYDLSAVITNPSGSQVILAITLSGITDVGFPATVLNLTTNNYLPATGLYGVASDRAAMVVDNFSLTT